MAASPEVVFFDTPIRLLLSQAGCGVQSSNFMLRYFEEGVVPKGSYRL
jgi:hypothetical protein